jgi:apolipoprotein N-acyltransferase
MRRLLAALATWTIIFLATPGILSRDGWGVLAFVALVPWALACSRPGRGAFWIEWLAAGIGISAQCIWSTYVLWITLLAVAVVPAFYVAVAGVVLRALARRFPLALAVPAAWVSLETLRFLAEPPFGFGWMRLGTHLHASAWIAGSARVFGVGGLSFVLAAFAGGVADVLRARVGSWRAADASLHRARMSAALALALAPLALALASSAVTSPPATVPGPRLLLVQPAIEQHRKMDPPKPVALYEDLCRLTASGLADAARAHEPVPDLVAWGETMFPAWLAEPGLAAAYDRGARAVPWAKYSLGRRDIAAMNDIETIWIRNVLFGEDRLGAGTGVLPEGASFVTGIEYFALIGGDIRRQNAILMWDAQGRRVGAGGKVHLVPGGEQLCGLERIAWVRDLAQSLSGYVPDLAPFDRTRVFTLHMRDGREAHFGVSVCFDNAYDDPYTQPLRDGQVDFHFVCSNEAWYERSFEYDQMVAFSRLLAITTGRSFVRATNAGITLAFDPSGREIARLSVDGEDRMVPGTLRVTVPVPSAGASAEKPFYVRSERVWQALWALLPLALMSYAAFARRSDGYTTGRGR